MAAIPADSEEAMITGLYISVLLVVWIARPFR